MTNESLGRSNDVVIEARQRAPLAIQASSGQGERKCRGAGAQERGAKRAQPRSARPPPPPSPPSGRCPPLAGPCARPLAAALCRLAPRAPGAVRPPLPALRLAAAANRLVPPHLLPRASRQMCRHPATVVLIPAAHGRALLRRPGVACRPLAATRPRDARAPATRLGSALQVTVAIPSRIAQARKLADMTSECSTRLHPAANDGRTRWRQDQKTLLRSADGGSINFHR